MKARSNLHDQAVVSNDERIGEWEFLRRQAIVGETVKSPFFNFQFFTTGQEEHSEQVEHEKNRLAP